MKYLDLIKLAKDAKKGITDIIKNRKAKNQLEGEVITIEGNIEDYKLKLTEVKMEYPFELNKILDWTNKLKLEERKLEQATALQKELF